MKRIGLIPWDKAVKQPDKIVALLELVDSVSVEEHYDRVWVVAHFEELPWHAWEIFDDIQMEDSWPSQ